MVELLKGDTGKGLDLFEVKHRVEHYGPNTISTKKGKGPLQRFLLQFHQPLIYFLIASGLVTAVLQGLELPLKLSVRLS